MNEHNTVETSALRWNTKNAPRRTYSQSFLECAACSFLQRASDNIPMTFLPMQLHANLVRCQHHRTNRQTHHAGTCPMAIPKLNGWGRRVVSWPSFINIIYQYNSTHKSRKQAICFDTNIRGYVRCRHHRANRQTDAQRRKSNNPNLKGFLSCMNLYHIHIVRMQCFVRCMFFRHSDCSFIASGSVTGKDAEYRL